VLADARPNLMIIMNLELSYWLVLRWRLELSQREIVAVAGLLLLRPAWNRGK
jgi:hypothetical protein